MRNAKLSVPIGAILSLSLLSIVFGAETSELFSPSMAAAFREKAVDLYTEPNATTADARQALVFLDTVNSLDRKSEYTLPDVVRLAWRFPAVDAHDEVKLLFSQYAVNDDADLEVLRLSAQYLVEPMNSREEREQFFMKIVRGIGTRHKVLGSDLVTQLGLLAAERSDMQTAEYFLTQATSTNPYNELAFQKLMEITPREISPAFYIYHLRLMVRANPYDIDTAYGFANSLYNVGMYELAASAYEYCAALFGALHPNEPLPPAIYLPWAISNYNEPRNLKQCLSIAESVDKNGAFDLYLEAIAGNAAIQLGNSDQGTQILDTAAVKAAQLLAKGHIQPQDVAWFYCFARPEPEKALQWANKANASEPNLPRTAALLAYALVMNGQQEIAKPLVEQNYKVNQIAALAMGQIELAKDPNADTNSGLAIIKSAVALDAGSLEAQRGKELLAQNGSTYVPAYETAAILKQLNREFGDAIVTKFVTADKIIGTKLVATGNEFPYGGHFNVSLAITNNSKEPLIISDGGLFNGNIRVDAVVKGDLNERIPNLAVRKIRPSEPLEPDRSLFVGLNLIEGRLKKLLLEHPQASVQIEFTTWLDPVTDSNGAVHNAITVISPARLVVTRNGVDVSGSYLQARLASLTKGQPGQKTKSAQLFSGLLLEQYATAGSKPYRMTYVDPQLLRSGLARCLGDEDWTLRAETMLMLGDLPLDYNLLNAVSENLDSKQPWPVRMTALWLLGKDDDTAFRKVRDWTAQNDDNKMVLEMAAALGAVVSPERFAKAASAAESTESVRLATAAEPNLFANSASAAAGALPFSTASPEKKTALPEPNQAAKAVVPEPPRTEETASVSSNQPAVSAEPNQPEKTILTEPNQPQEEKSDTNDIIEDILKS
jgi:hypothetical protein